MARAILTVGKSSLLLPARRSMLDMHFFLAPTGDPGGAAANPDAALPSGDPPPLAQRHVPPPAPVAPL